MTEEQNDNINVNDETSQEDTVAAAVEMSEDEALDKILGSVETGSVASEQLAAEIKDDVEGDAVTEELLRALRRDGVPADIIEQVSKDPQALSDWATKAQKRQADVDAYTEKVKTLESEKTEEGEQTPEEISEVSEPTDAEESKVETIQLDALVDELGEEAVEPIRKMQEQLTSLQAQLEEANRSVAMSEVQLAVEQVAPTVLKPWGDISDANRSAILERMSELGKTKPRTFGSIEELMSEAAGDVLGVPSVTKRSATPSPPSRVAKLERPASVEDREDAALDVILNGGTVDQAKQASMR